MTRGQDGSLFLSCTALSSATQCRFIPAHQAEACPTKRREKCPRHVPPRQNSQSRAASDACPEVFFGQAKACPTMTGHLFDRLFADWANREGSASAETK